jgi:hypothetical protein
MNVLGKAGLGGRPRGGRRAQAAALAAAGALVWSLAGSACGSTPAPATPGQAHGQVVAHLSIPFRPAGTALGTEVLKVTVPAGRRFAVKVDTSDGPFFWSITGSPPDTRVVRFVGNFNQGSCPADQVGCRVPYFHTMLARGPGTTTMTWRYHDLPCQATPPPNSQASGASGQSARSCPRVSVVVFDITVR